VEPLFPRWSDGVFRLVLATVAVGAVALVVAPLVWARTPYVGRQGEPVTQPIKFDHRHHVHDDGIACLYCHEGARRSRYAGVPSTATCMGCHAQVWTTSPELAPLRDAWFTGTNVAWRRVNSVPDFVFFDHSIHVKKGVDCAECHGAVDRMAEVYETQPLTMAFCLDCHRARDASTDCTACHR
jgi:Cytochrome c7 and related cytochrome c